MAEYSGLDLGGANDETFVRSQGKDHPSEVLELDNPALAWAVSQHTDTSKNTQVHSNVVMHLAVIWKLGTFKCSYAPRSYMETIFSHDQLLA